MALEELKTEFKDNPEALKRLDELYNSAHSVGQENNIGTDYARRMAEGQSLMTGGGVTYYTDGDGNKLDNVAGSKPAWLGGGEKKEPRAPKPRQGVTYDNMHERAQEIVNPRVQSMLSQIETAMLRAGNVMTNDMAARGHATGGVKASAERELGASEMLQKQSTVLQGESQTAALAQDMYSEERGFEMQQSAMDENKRQFETQLDENKRQFESQMSMAMKEQDYQKMRDLVNDKKWDKGFELQVDQFEFSKDSWAKEFGNKVNQQAVDNAFKQQGLNLEGARLAETRRGNNMSYNIAASKLAHSIAMDKNAASKTTNSKTMAEYTKRMPDVFAVAAKSGKETAFSNISFMESKGIISQAAADMMVESLTVPAGGYGVEDLTPYIETQFLQGEKGSQSIGDKQEFIGWMVGNSPNLETGVMDQINSLYGIKNSEVNKWYETNK